MAEALLRTGSGDYTVRAGATLDELSKFALQGDLRSVSNLYNLYRAAVPADERQVREAVPVKILNQFFYRAEQNATKAVDRWQDERPTWRRELEAALPDPIGFDALARAMAFEIKALEARQAPIAAPAANGNKTGA
jgi:hypothetical protein